MLATLCRLRDKCGTQGFARPGEREFETPRQDMPNKKTFFLGVTVDFKILRYIVNVDEGRFDLFVNPRHVCMFKTAEAVNRMRCRYPVPALSSGGRS
jgi:hypothetical protein